MDAARSEAEYCELVRSELAEATRIRLVADVPLGAFLSGGLDSTIIAGLARRIFQQALSKHFQFASRRRSTMKARLRDAPPSVLDTDHHEFFVEEQDLLGVLPELVRHYDEPFRRQLRYSHILRLQSLPAST